MSTTHIHPATATATATSSRRSAARTAFAGLGLVTALALSGCAASASANAGDDDTGSGVDTDTTWVLVGGTDSEGALPVEAGDVTLIIGDGGIGGEVCNAYGGDFTGSVGTSSPGQISISEVFSTQMWCEADGLMELETRFHAALQSATEAQISGGTLHLNGDDVRLRFREG